MARFASKSTASSFGPLADQRAEFQFPGASSSATLPSAIPPSRASRLGPVRRVRIRNGSFLRCRPRALRSARVVPVPPTGTPPPTNVPDDRCCWFEARRFPYGAGDLGNSRLIEQIQPCGGGAVNLTEPPSDAMWLIGSETSPAAWPATRD